MSTPKFYDLRVINVRREAPETVSLAFAVPPALVQAFAFGPASI